MINKDDGGPDFPLKEPLMSDCLGMTLRDYFAAHATEADIQYYSLYAEYNSNGMMPKNARVLARYFFADDMLEARKK